MKAFFTHIILLLFSGAAIQAQHEYKTVQIISEKSYVTIHGTTNLSSFQFTYASDLSQNQVAVMAVEKENEVEIQHEAIQLKVCHFKCENEQMTKELHELLKYKQYPFISFQLNKISNSSTAHIMIEMAGKKQAYSLQLANSVQKNTIKTSAKMPICITDFGLKPPEKFFGMVKVDENIEVRFTLSLMLHNS